MAEYLTGAVRFNGGELEEVVIYPIEPDPELEALGHLQMDYIVDAHEVIKGIKKGDVYHASFSGTGKLYRLEIVSRDGKETLEIADVGQPQEFKTLRNLPEPG
jgi:hypothetical protein